ncbi:MAG: HAMP domain-containing protein, partial [Alphaproteobacteria bacterium]
VVLSALTGWFMARRALSGVGQVTRTAREISAGDLDRRVPAKAAGDEIDQLARTFNHMLDRIQTLVNGMREMSDNIAHDLKTPLSRLRNRIETTLREARGEEAYREALTAAIEDADNLIKTFDALLSIARLEAGAASNRGRMQFDLSAMVTDVCELYEPVAEERGLELRQSHASEIMVAGEQQLLAQAIANVVDNAIKYASPDVGGDAMHADNARTNGAGPHITVSLETRGGQAEISVADTGPGIPAADRERALKRFGR